MTIEQKAQRFDEAIRIAQELYNSPNSSKVGKGYVCTVFPELKEREDERIKVAAIEFVRKNKSFNYHLGISKEKVLAWLEKQGESKKVSIWKHWKNEIAGNGEGKQIYLIKIGNTYKLSSCLSFECDYIELSELDNLMLERQGEQKPLKEHDICDTCDEKASCVIPCPMKLVEQKPAWSEEDEKILKELLQM